MSLDRSYYGEGTSGIMLLAARRALEKGAAESWILRDCVDFGAGTGWRGKGFREAGDGEVEIV